MEFHLEEWGDGTIRLAHWDMRHGCDTVFILGELGMATLASVDNKGEKRIPVESLVLELRKLIKETQNGTNS